MVKKINSSEFEQVKNNKAIIVDFSAEWCGPCKMLAPVMEQLSDEITDVEFYNIDVDENPDLAREYRIMNIPAVIAIKGGQGAGQHDRGHQKGTPLFYLSHFLSSLYF